MHRTIRRYTGGVAALAACLSASADPLQTAGPQLSPHSALAMAQVSPHALAAAGVTPEALTSSQLLTSFASATAALPQQLNALALADSQTTRLRANAQRTGVTISLDRERAALTAQRSILRRTVQDASIAINDSGSALALQTGGVAGQRILSGMIANGHRPVPDTFKALDLGEEQWALLQAALRKTERGASLASAERHVLQSVQAHLAVNLVRQRLQNNSQTLTAQIAGASPLQNSQ